MAKGVDDPCGTTGLNTLLAALYLRIDDWLGRRGKVGPPPKLSDAELLTLGAVAGDRGRAGALTGDGQHSRSQ